MTPERYASCRISIERSRLHLWHRILTRYILYSYYETLKSLFQFSTVKRYRGSVPLVGWRRSMRSSNETLGWVTVLWLADFECGSLVDDYFKTMTLEYLIWVFEIFSLIIWQAIYYLEFKFLIAISRINSFRCPNLDNEDLSLIEAVNLATTFKQSQAASNHFKWSVQIKRINGYPARPGWVNPPVTVMCQEAKLIHL